MVAYVKNLKDLGSIDTWNVNFVQNQNSTLNKEKPDSQKILNYGYFIHFYLIRLFKKDKTSENAEHRVRDDG